MTAMACCRVSDRDGRPGGLRRIDQGRDVAASQVVGLGVPDGPLQRQVPHAHHGAGVPAAIVASAWRTSAAGSWRSLRLPRTFRIGSRTFWFFLTVLAERAGEPVGQPVLGGLAYGVGGMASFRGDPLVDVGVQGLQLVLDRGLGLARDLPPDPPRAVRAVPQGYDPAPDAGAAVIPARIPARAAPVLEADRVLTPPAPLGHEPSLRQVGPNSGTILSRHPDPSRPIRA